MMTTRKKENIIIMVAWVLIFLSTPLYMYYANLTMHEKFDWQELESVWAYNIAFLLLFLVHHYVIIPRYVTDRRTFRYIACILCCFFAFALYIRIVENHYHDLYSLERKDIHKHVKPGFHRPRHLGPVFPFLPPPVMARLIMGAMMIGVDLGAVAWINQQKMQRRLLLLEQQNTKQELEQLRYQINPHFFMNTMNNIHALVDIDKERAKESIVELSRLMRYALYEGSETMVDVNHEIEFLKMYVSLMKLRYSNKVEVVCNMPQTNSAGIVVPPLLLATFVENAFKHGISYMHKSFVHIEMKIDEEEGTIIFSCINSLPQKTDMPHEKKHHGIGLENVRKRLHLQYGDSFELKIKTTDSSQYAVTLTLPTHKA